MAEQGARAGPRPAAIRRLLLQARHQRGGARIATLAAAERGLAAWVAPADAPAFAGGQHARGLVQLTRVRALLAYARQEYGEPEPTGDGAA
jgi:hypothetical protein